MNSKEVPVEQLFDKVEKKIDKGHIKDAQAALEEIRADDFSGLPILHKAKVYYLYAKLLFKKGQYKKALLKIKVALRLSALSNNCSTGTSFEFISVLLKLFYAKIPAIIVSIIHRKISSR